MTLPLHPDLPDLERHYDQEILPVLLTLERERDTKVMRARILMAIIGALGGGALIYFARRHGSNIAFLGSAGLAGLLIMIWSQLTSGVGKRAKHVFVRGLLEGAMGWVYSETSYEPQIFSVMKDLGFFKLHTLKDFSDSVSGKVMDRKFELTEIHLQTQGKNSKHTVFRGMLLGIDAQVAFSGTVIARRKKFGKPKSNVDLKPVGLASPTFNTQFNVFADDQVAARELLSPTFMTQIIELEAAFKGKNLQLAFMNGRVFIVMETHDQFEIKNLSKTLLDRSRFDLLQSEINAIYHLAQGLKPKTPEQWRQAFK